MLPNVTQVQLAFILGPLTHLCIFIHGELNRYAVQIAASFVLAFFTTLLVIYCLESDIVASIVKANVLIFTYLLALGGSILTYRVFFHRLRQFPGDTIDSLSKWGAVFKAQRNAQYYLELRDLHKKYGDFVRIGPSELSINNVSAVRAIHSSQCTKGPWYDLGGTNINIHRTRDLEQHDRQRVFWDKAASGTALRDFSKKINDHVIRLVDELGTGRPVNTITLFETSSFELMSSISFSEEHGQRSSQELAEMLSTLHTNQLLLIGLGHVPWVYTFREWFPFLIPSTAKFRAYASEMLNRRLALKPTTPDLFSYLSQAEDSDSPHFPIEWEARLSTVAGSINDSALLTAITYYLAKDQTFQSALRAEVLPLVTSGTFDPRHALPLLEATIQETLRLQPSIPSGTERLTPPSGLYLTSEVSCSTTTTNTNTDTDTNTNATIFIPGNTVVRIPNFTICRDPRYFVSPDTFIPERWTTRKELVRDERCFFPFGLGPYSCAGKQLGLMKTRATVAALVAAFTWRLAKGMQEGELLGRDEFSVAFGACWVEFERI